MAIKKTYGSIRFEDRRWVIDSIEPHVAIKLKNIFLHLRATQLAPFHFDHTMEMCADLLWLMGRYPLSISDKDLRKMKSMKRKYVRQQDELEGILMPYYEPKPLMLKDGLEARDYQIVGRDFMWKVKRTLLGDELGLGKTVTGIISVMNPGMLPAFVVCQSHMTRHWSEKIQMFSNLDVHVIETGKAYKLPKADIYLTKYTILAKWIHFFERMPYKTVIFDEIQEVRRSESDKHIASRTLSWGGEFSYGLSATPIYNYGSEIWNIMHVIKKNSLGSWYDFNREWCGNGKVVNNPKALGAYLRESGLMLRRTRKDVGRELPPVNTIIHEVSYDDSEIRKADEIARTLALKYMEGTYIERGQAARELDMLARHSTGVAKARHVAEYVKFMVQAGQKVVLAGWHRDVYKIWERELAAYDPVMYTGSESPAQKAAAVKEFVEDRSKVFIISLRSGVGLDGLQFASSVVIFGELDWSPQVMRQLVGRVDRDGQEEQVTAIYLITKYGADLPIMDMLGVKSSQSHYINDPLEAIPDQHSDESRMKALALKYLDKQEA